MHARPLGRMYHQEASFLLRVGSGLVCTLQSSFSQRKGQGVLHQGKSSVWQDHADTASELWKNL